MGKMKANRKFIEADERAVSAVIGVILMVAITVAIAATVYVYVSGMIGGTKTQTPNVACTTDATANKITVATADAAIKWSDIVITNDSGVTLNWDIYTGGGVTATGVHVVPASTILVTAGDYIYLSGTFIGNSKITLMYKPTNSLLGSWTVNV
ncbi:MAG TPA: type IV pilin N-terminal domain-containing protein [Candidatus Thermoplasmatota archaeon]|nr:type IV pilin N-terminal domain-containing protein [Candidatus Thermoplasmatota archaeon]